VTIGRTFTPTASTLLAGFRPSILSLLLLAAVFCALLGTTSVLAAGPGEKLYRELVEKEQLYPDEEWQAYVQAVGDRLVAVSPDAGKKYHFYVLDNSAVNAMALPDGYIFINRGLIAYLRSEDELAGVLGHEIGHVVGSHARRSNQLGAFGNVLGFIGAVMTGSYAVADLANTATTTIRSGYGREFELEADSYGGEFLAKAGYNPLAMIDVLHVLKDHQLFSNSVRKEPNVYHGLFSSHPRNDKRLHDAVMKSQGLVPDSATLLEPERDFWEMMNGMVFGDEAATGLIKDGAYYHGALRVVFQFPEGWDVTNTAAEVLARPPQGPTHSSIAVQRLNPPATEQTPEQFVTETLKRDDVKSGESREINGYRAYVAEIEVADTAATQARKIAVIYKDSSVYLFKGEVGALGSVDEFDAQWQRTLESFRAMTAADLRQASNQRIKVVTAKPDETFAELAKRVPLKQFPEETLRLINGLHPVGEPRAGDYIKIIE
jgi:predicted Zn-dependent protease